VPVATGGLRVLAVDALSADEALLLARELPHLNTLIRGDLPGVGREVSRRLALGVLNIAQGHPKLLELADGQAADPERLGELVAAGDQAWREQGGLPDGFFTGGQPPAGHTPAGHAPGGPPGASAADYLHVLGAWTRTVAGGLPPGERTLFWFLCCLEEPDRERSVLDGNWAGLWTRLDRDGQPPALDQALTAVTARGLIAVRPQADDAGESYAVHPGIAAAGRAQAGQPFRDAVDAQAAAFWDAVYRFASGETDGAVRTGLMVRAGLAAVPYLLRRERWAAAAAMLERALSREPSRANAAAVLPAIQEIASHDATQAGVLARVLEVLDPAAGEHQVRAYLDAVVASGDYRSASVAAGRLAYLCYDSGRLPEALVLIEQAAGYTRQAGLGPWTQLADEVQRLQVLNAMGQGARVLAEVHRLRDRMGSLPVAGGPDETLPSWNVRDALLGTGRDAAAQLGQWQDALDLNAAIIAGLGDRGTPRAVIAESRFNDYFPLVRLGRAEEALTLLRGCREVFQEARNTRALGKTLGALADIEDTRGHGDTAITLARDALRYKYLAGDVDGIAISYYNLGTYLAVYTSQYAEALACHLAAALIRVLIGAADVDDWVSGAAIDLRASGTAPPAGVPALCRQLGDIPGADLASLLAALAPDPATAEQALRDLIAQAQAQASAPPDAGPAPPA
jgi:tetratricopeptide (TPR) repeat protein